MRKDFYVIFKVMSEALFDREIRKSQGVDVDEPKGLRNFSKESSLGKKRPPNESDDEKAPDSKRLKKSEGKFHGSSAFNALGQHPQFIILVLSLD